MQENAHWIQTDWILPDKMRGVRVRPWCWEVAGPWTVAAWFTTPAVPPHQASRWQSGCLSVLFFVLFFCFIPKAERWLHLPVSSPGQHSPLSPFPNLRYICDSCGRKICKLDSKGIIRSVERDFLWVFACWVHITNPDVRDSGGLWPTSLHLTGITPPTTLCFSSGASALHSSNNIPYANFIITPQQWGMCVSVQWRGI